MDVREKMVKCGDCLHNSMCDLTHSPNSLGCCEFADKNRLVEVVLCKDCIHFDKDFQWCDRHRIRIYNCDFCSYGERKEGADNG